MINFYRRFIGNAAAIQAPLNEYLKGAKRKDKRPIVWTEEAEKAFQNCKDSLANAASLVHPTYDSPLLLTTDASNSACGAALQQKVNGTWKPIAFFSRKLSPQEINYSTYDRELTAVYKAVKHFKHLLEGRNFTIQTTSH